MKRKKLLRIAVGIMGAFCAQLIYRVFRKKKRQAVKDLRENSQVFQTARGPIEAVTQGEGPAVLIIHGGGGGYDQGLLFFLPETDFQFIAPSRPGYLQTPLESGPTFEAQADSYTALLDSLGIRKAALLCTSGGGPSALQFALRYPNRCWGLILVSAISRPIPEFPRSMQQFTEKIMPYFDFLPWLILNTPILYLLIDRNTRSQIGNDPDKKAMLQRLMWSMFPVSLRVKGAMNDVQQIADLADYPLGDIHLPTLVIHGVSDSIVPFSQGEYCANTIPNAQFIPIENGDHFSFITHNEVVKPALIAFIESHAPSYVGQTRRQSPG